MDRRSVIAVALIVLVLPVLSGCADRPADRVLVVGHRGAPGYRPEHTAASYRLAIEMGADYIEPDLVITKDGVLIVRHENEIGGTTDVAGKFPERRTTKVVDGEETTGWFAEDFTLAEIKTLRARERLEYRDRSHDGKHEVLTFEEVIRIARSEPGRTVGIAPETKHPTYFRNLGLPLEEPLVTLLDRYGYRGRESPVIVQSFEPGNLVRLRKMTDVRLLLLLGDPDERPVGETKTYGEFTRPEELRALAKTVQGIGPAKALVIPTGGGEPTSLVEDARAAGLFVVPWTFRSDPQHLPERYEGDAIAEYLEFYRLGVFAVFTDFPDIAVQARARFERP
jgi:glycerophosphoryl diester phosphodiesterase